LTDFNVPLTQDLATTLCTNEKAKLVSAFYLLLKHAFNKASQSPNPLRGAGDSVSALQKWAKSNSVRMD
jgi:hypothetical protein